MQKDAMVWTLALLVLCGWGALQLRGAGPSTPPSRVVDEKPPTEEEKQEQLAEEKYQKIIGYLIQEYRRIGESKDWLTRGLTTISIARLPQSRANKELLRV